MLDVRERLLGSEPAEGCRCVHSFDGERLVVDAGDCPGGGLLAAEQHCRETVVGVLSERDAAAVSVETAGVERLYEGASAALLTAAGRFVERVAVHDERLAARARRDPLGAAREATGRVDAVSDIAAETGLAELAARAESYERALAACEGPTVSRWRVEPTPPPTELCAARELDTGGTVRRYERDGPDRYQLTPAESELGAESLAVLAAAYDHLAAGTVDGGDRAPARAVRAAVADRSGESEIPVERVATALAKHTRGHGLLSDLFADPAVSDVFVTAPAADNRVRVTVDDETLVTNVRPTERAIEGLASRFRRESGRAFSRADPTLDATTTVADRRVRVAGVTDPTSDGAAFAFRAQDRDVWTLPALVENGTLTPEAAALLSLSVERGRALLVVGPRGAGKTTLLGALLWELPPAVRTVVIEDTPELPVGPLQEAGRDVQALLAGEAGGELSPAEALRTALRLGDGALAVGEVRGEEAGVLYEAMRVGANSEAVLGTIHGDGGEAVFERVVSDLGVPASSFGVTDLLVTLERASGGRRVRLIEEVVGGDEPQFGPLFERTGDGLVPTGRVDRGNSRLVASLATPEESYAAVRDRLDRRTRLLETLATRGETGGERVTAAHARR
jgi:type IV secretory pathway ATPase VirB11/archaellum biosynthesis ATPase